MIQKLALGLLHCILTWEKDKHCTDWTFRTKPTQMESVNLHNF